MGWPISYHVRLCRVVLLRRLLHGHGCTAQELVKPRLVTRGWGLAGMAMYSSHPYFKPIVYGLLNIISASGIVFANKTVFAVYGFKFTACLTLIHTVVTLFGMHAFVYNGLFQVKQLPQIKLLPLAAT
jgi:hypothetical protein